MSLDSGDPNQPAGWTVDDTEPHDQIVYYLFINQLNFTPTDPGTWEVTPQKGFVKLYARNINGSYIHLATYKSLPFKMIVSKNPLTYPAPSRNAIVSQTWGEIKTR